MKLELIAVIAGTAIVSSSLTIVTVRYCDGRRNEKEHRVERIQTAVSNYNHTFKLNTATPVWPEQDRRSDDSTNRVETNSR